MEKVESDDGISASGVSNENDADMGKQDNMEQHKLLEQLEQLKTDKKKLQNEFNTQRAKLKELFIQKEQDLSKSFSENTKLQQELNELKSQFLVADLNSESERLKEKKAQEEISSLQQLVQDTIEELALCKGKLENLKEERNQLLLQNRELRDGLQQQQQQQQQQENSISLPQSKFVQLSQVKRTLVRKLGAESNSSAVHNSSGQDSIDDSMMIAAKNSGKPYAHEDAEVLRSIVEQLQEEMKALKEKLRETDEKLQERNENASNTVLNSNPDANVHKSTLTDGVPTVCDKCENLEQLLQQHQTTSLEQNDKLDMLQKVLLESQENLQKEAALRKDLEDQWQEKREAHKAEVQLLREQVKTNEQKLLYIQQTFLDTKNQIMQQMRKITDERERVNKQLETLQADNDFLSGRYLATSEEIENQYINLPNTVVELQELILRQQSELIQARVCSEFESKNCKTSSDEIQLLRDQLEANNNEFQCYKRKVQMDTKSLQDRLTEHLLTVQNYETSKATLERKESELNRTISEIRLENIELHDTNEKLTKTNSEFKSKIKNLQEDLATSEQVQKDFVRLSQTLQMSLEKLRHADIEVRWQDDDDVDNCPSCSTYFTVTCRKIHCRHCGHIYCDKCLTKTVPSGPRKRAARVCDICHTLLTPNTAPYFSHDPLQSN